eukprot:TRINITY_DN10522_c0_g2_i2.p2 TRINITY_DN10522_c0_g2~~TRINITY_DN10522_c0_g2_i2.p2  ORF type:complete len:196 (+),score=73.02 TRINITY_DN10522_c0_g2_i2:571-1158(+)
MNFLAGFFILVTDCEAEAFTYMRAVIERYGMQRFYIKDMPLLKEYFYKLDRLLSMTYPGMSNFLRIEGVNTNFYASSWFMTVFSQLMQHAKEDEVPEMLLRVWDCFLLDGWKAVFKVGLFILAELKDKILNSRFEKVIAVLGDVLKGRLFYDPVATLKLKREYKKYKVTNTLLKRFEEEYRVVQEEVYGGMDNGL